MRKGLMVLMACLLAGLAHAGTDAVTRRQIESSMLVLGTLSVDATGAVTSYTLDQRDKLPPPVVTLLDRTLPQFRFRPVEHDGKAQAVQAKMSLRMVVNQVDPTHVALRLSSAHFTETDPPLTERGTIEHRTGMHYPYEALREGVAGTVYVAVRFDRSGQVLDADARQVDLKFTDSEAKMKYWRDVLARPAVAAIRRFTFHPPTTGPHAGDATFTGILPVAFLFDGMHLPKYGEWDTYVPGPKRDIPWLHEDAQTAAGNEAVPDGEFAMTGGGLELLTPLGG